MTTDVTEGTDKGGNEGGEMSTWDEKTLNESKAKLAEAEAQRALATNVELTTAKAAKERAEANVVKERIEAETLMIRAKSRRYGWIAIHRICGAAFGVHTVWATAAVAVAYILGVLMTEILQR